MSRRDEQLTALMGNMHHSYEGMIGDAFDRLLTYFDNHEPAVADAIRYGLSKEL